MVVKALIGLGSNLEQPIQQVKMAVSVLSELSKSTVLAYSSLYQSQPQGPQDQDEYINAAVLIETALTPLELLQALQKIEQNFGRIKTRHWGERIIDLDILFYGQQQINLDEPDLCIPHREVLNRDFALIPVLEICPEWRLPNGTELKVYAESASQFVRHKITE